MNDFLDLLYKNSVSPAFCVDIKEVGDAYVVEAELPGFKKENIEITYENNILSIVAEKKEVKEENERYLLKETCVGKYTRKIRLEKVDEAGITAKLVDGILTVVAPKNAKAVTKVGISVE